MSRLATPSHRPSRATTGSDPFHGMNAATFGIGCLLLAVGCISATFWNTDLAVQAGATLLGVALMSSGVIALLAGDV